MNPTESQRELLLRHLEGRLTAEERAQVNDWLRTDPQARAFLRELAEQAVMIADLEREALGRQEVLHEHGAMMPAASSIVPMPGRTPASTFARTLLAIAASIIMALGASLYFQAVHNEPHIAKVAGISGAVQWTGNGGRVLRELSLGTELSGGTIEGLAPGSWFELEFKDGSTVEIFGNAVLTFSENGQKKLHLKEGSLSANVKPQPPGRPMLIHTRSAVVEVLGTQFEIEAELATTTLNVSKGTVRIKRLSDGATVDVPARHRAVAVMDQELSVVPLPAPVNHWRSHLNRGPAGLGNWSPPSGTRGASIGTVPYTTEQGKTIFALGFGVSCGKQPPVILEPGARLHIRGRLAASHPVFFGLTVRRENGEFAGKFQTIRPAVEFPAGQDFDVVLDLRDFQLDPSLSAIKHKLPPNPFHLVVESTWCHTLYQRAGLDVSAVELIPPNEPPAVARTNRAP